jgi:hypothetical protein
MWSLLVVAVVEEMELAAVALVVIEKVKHLQIVIQLLH